MKKNLLLAIATVFAAMATVNAQTTEGLKRELNVENSAFMNQVARTAMPYDVVYVGEFFDAEAINGATIGAFGGYTRDGWEAGASFGYAGLKWQANASFAYGEGKFDNKSYLAPSGFVDAQVALVRWGKKNGAKTWALYLGGKVGYKHAEKSVMFNGADDHGNTVSGEVEGYGSGWLMVP